MFDTAEKLSYRSWVKQKNWKPKISQFLVKSYIFLLYFYYVNHFCALECVDISLGA